MIYRTATDGLAFNRELLLLYIATGLIAASIGRGHKVFAVVRDWLPFALVLVLYDLSRGAADMLGGPPSGNSSPTRIAGCSSALSRRSGCRSTSRWRSPRGGK